MSAMTYKGYSARIEFDADDHIFVGHIAGINDIVGFHADNVAELEATFREVVDDYLDSCQQLGKTPDKPYSGKLMLRIPSQIHARAAARAEMAGKSLNAWATEALAQYA